MNDDKGFAGDEKWTIGILDGTPAITCSCSGKCTNRLRTESPFECTTWPISYVTGTKLELPDFIAFVGPEIARNGAPE